MLFALVTDTNQHEAVFCALPHSVESNFHLMHVVRNPNLVGKLVNHKPAFRIVPHIIRLELPLIIMSRLEPRYHRMLIGFPYLMLVCPLIIFGFIDVKWLALKLKWILVVAELESVVVVSALLLNAQVTRLGKCND